MIDRTLSGLLVVGFVLASVVALADEPSAPQDANPQDAAAQASPKPVYQPVGAPADPKVPARWNYYRDYAQATKLLEGLAEAHPEICKLQSLGKSYGEREMWVMTIADPDGPPLEDRAAFWIDGGIHANELQAVDVVLYTAWYLCESHDRSEWITNLLKERVFYLMPMMSPDSRDAHMYRPNSTNSPRGGQRPVDDDRDGKVNEDGPDDLNNDGHITFMRVRDARGRWKSMPEHPLGMVPIEEGEQGEFRMLGQEGFDNDGDGRVNEDGDGYYDPNRDWAWQWQPRAVQYGAFRYPFSVGENRMVADFVMAHPHIAGAQSYHNTGGMILRGPGVKGQRWPARDNAVYDKLGKRGVTMLPGYRYLNTADDLYEVYGGETDWFFEMLGVFAFTNELNTPYNLFREKSEGGGFFGNLEERYRFNRDLLFEDGFVPWEEVDHPQYGKIEVGGFKKTWVRQPPSFLLEEECHRNMAFTLFHASEMPQVRVEKISVRKLSDDLHEVTALVVNDKIIPTHAAVDLRNKLTPPNRVRLTGENVTVVAALVSDEPFFEDAREVERQPADVRVRNISQQQPVYIRWLVRGSGDYQVEVRSIKGGKHTHTWTPPET